MDYNFLDSAIANGEKEISDVPSIINPFILKNSEADIKKAVDFLGSEESVLYIHGFLGTGKRQIINYLSKFTNKQVIKLEYYCKDSTVCDDILLDFIAKVEKTLDVKTNLNAKITTLIVKFKKLLEETTRPILIILHSFDDISSENVKLVINNLTEIGKSHKIKMILSTRGMVQDILGEDIKIDRQVFIKGFSKEIFKKFIEYNKIECADRTLEDFYKYTRGYYYYTALVIKIVQAMKLSINEFLDKFIMSGMSFDEYLGVTYVNIIPQAIRNFFWFLRTIRHGLSFNALAVLELYDEFSVEYLKNNLMIFIADDIIYVQDYFQQSIDISIPSKTEIKLHKYIISIYEQQLKEPLNTRTILISRQSMRAEIDYHNKCIASINEGSQSNTNNVQKEDVQEKVQEQPSLPKIEKKLEEKIIEAQNYEENNNLTKAIEAYQAIIDNESIGLFVLTDIRHRLAVLYKKIEDYKKAQHYYELVEKYYLQNNEIINLNYLYYEMTELYFIMYKTDRAIETIKKVIYSVDTPASLMVDACTLLGNIYSDVNNPDEAYNYYLKALESLDENASDETRAELYFKYALVNDERENQDTAFEYYTKCISLGENNLYKASAYSNMGSCYYENDNISDAKDCFEKAYQIEKSANNYDGIYYNAINLAKIYSKIDKEKTLQFLKEANQSAEFLNENNYMMDSSVALGDFYYNNPNNYKEALIEYYKARKIGDNIGDMANVKKLDERIKDMQLRMDNNDFEEIRSKYE